MLTRIKSSNMDAPVSGLLSSNLKFLDSGKYSDLTLRCGEKEWHVHRVYLCGRSKFFAAACDGGFLVSYVSSSR